MDCVELPPLAPGNFAVLGHDGERPAWFIGTPGQVMIIGPNGPAFVDPSAIGCAVPRPRNVEPPALRKPPPTIRGTRRQTKPPPKNR